MRYFMLLLMLTILVSCDETSKPSSDYLVEKTVTSSSDEQVVQSGDNFRIVFPANSLNGNLDIKVKKESSAPDLGIPNLKAGKNFFKIKFSGNTDFLKPVQIIINYDKSSIPVGKTTQESVFGYIYSSGSWKLANYQLDQANEKIIISISSSDGKVSKDEPILLDDGEFIIGDGYTTTDTGQSDNPLSRYNFFSFLLISNIVYDDGSTNEDDQWSYEFTTNSPGIKWNGNNFSFTRMKIEPKNWITEYETDPDSIVEYGYGSVAPDGKKLIKFTYENYEVKRTYYSSSDNPDITIATKSFTLENLKIDLPNLQLYPNSFPYEEITGTEVSKYISKLNDNFYWWRWDSFYNKENTGENKSYSYNWNGSYSRISISFLKLEEIK